jgi:CheY-like chemotaxis protein
VLDRALVEEHPALQGMLAIGPGRRVRLRVSDDGAGMDSATRARIFEPFFTTKPVDEGTGLGLSVVHGIVVTHEGVIEVNSQLGKGTTFTVYLPVAAPANHASASEPQRAAGDPLVRVSPLPEVRQHILYIDDDESLVFLIERLLERRGFRISGFTDQKEALDALRANPADFDLVVSDYNMPGLSGLDVAREVKLIRPDLPVAVASGFIDETLREQAEGAGVCELIFKANAVEDLSEAFARLAHAVGEADRGHA